MDQTISSWMSDSLLQSRQVVHGLVNDGNNTTHPLVSVRESGGLPAALASLAGLIALIALRYVSTAEIE
jgi:hypothetical protein